jgi:HSP20 family molecular chaperone IbpA
MLPLPTGVDADKAKASSADGVLEVTIPLPPGRGGRKIETSVEKPQKPSAAA